MTKKKTKPAKKSVAKASTSKSPTKKKAERGALPSEGQAKPPEEGTAAPPAPPPMTSTKKKRGVTTVPPAPPESTGGETAAAPDPVAVAPLAPPAAPTEPAAVVLAAPAVSASAEPGSSESAGATSDGASGSNENEPAEPRLPPVGTVLRNVDRHGVVRCEASVVPDGVSYAGKVYRSLSAAALAAARDLGLTATTINGRVWFGLAKTARSATGTDPLSGLERAWDRYQEQLGKLLERAGSGEHRGPILTAVQRHARVLQNQHDEVAGEKGLPACPTCGGEGETPAGEGTQPCGSCRGEGVLRNAS